MTDEERTAILNESRATLERLKDFKRPEVNIPPLPDRLEQWREWHAERDAEREQAKWNQRRIERQIQQQQVEQRQVDIETRIAQAIEVEREFMIEVIGRFAGELRSKMHDELEKLFRRQLETLKMEIDSLRQELVKFIGNDVKELPDVLQYKRNQVNVN
jgi:hypothetical protein